MVTIKERIDELDVTGRDLSESMLKAGGSVETIARSTGESRARLAEESVLVSEAAQSVAGPLAPANEEWTYCPPGLDQPLAWRVQVKWRVGVAAGFENATGFHVQSLTPAALAGLARERLADLRTQGRLSPALTILE